MATAAFGTVIRFLLLVEYEYNEARLILLPRQGILAGHRPRM